jgi:hypothetical protein
VSIIVAFIVKNIDTIIFFVSLVHMILHMQKFRKKLKLKCNKAVCAYAWTGVNTGNGMHASALACVLMRATILGTLSLYKVSILAAY